MATTSQTEIGTNTKNDGKSYSYPAGIAGVPFASFLRIYKYSYDEGMANVASQQNDVQGALQNSGLLNWILMYFLYSRLIIIYLSSASPFMALARRVV